MKWIIFLLAIFFLASNVNAQSIGIIPAKSDIEVYTNQPAITNIRLSQAAGYNEIITIKPKGVYDWISLEETEFNLEPGVRKIINLYIHTDKNGVYNAEFEICASGSETGTLTVIACTTHKLTVTSVTSPGTMVVATTAIAGSLLFISGLGFFMWRRSRQVL